MLMAELFGKQASLDTETPTISVFIPILVK